MSHISEALWGTEFSDPMPEGTTYKQFATRCKLKELSESIRDQMAYVKKLKLLEKSPTITELIKDQEIILGKLYIEKRKFETEGLHEL